ncbi:MAG: M28 family peptidase [Nitrospinae bacterium]|nr:M28 family peptidase [Nitrospinota bacterium]
MIQMPGKSYHGPLPALAEAEISLQHELREHVEKLAGEIGERNLIWYKNLTAAAEYIEASLTKAGYAVHQHGYEVSGRTSYNLEVEIAGTDRPEEIVVIGAHYDSVTGSPGANDNATGVAAVLALAGRFSGQRTSRTLRFVAFVNEEPPFFQTSSMGSRVYAQASRQRGEKVVAMLSLETIGYYAEEDGSQRYPPPMSLFYPSTGNFIAFVGNVKSGPLVREVVGSFRSHAKFPSEGAAFPGFIPGVGWSDHWAFWKEGYPAVMVTDTAPFRYPAYHSHQDTPEKVKYDQMARVVGGLGKVIADLANPASGP